MKWKKTDERVQTEDHAKRAQKRKQSEKMRPKYDLGPNDQDKKPIKIKNYETKETLQ